LTSHPSLSFFGKKHDNVNVKRLNRKRAGVSPVISTTIIIAITVVLGLGLWAFANSGVSTATQSYLDTVTKYGEFTSNTFAVANIDFNNPSNNHIAFWIFNSGKQTTDFCHYDPNNPFTCETNPSVAILCRDSGVPLAGRDLCQQDPIDPSLCLTRVMPDGNTVNDFRVAPNELGKFYMTVDKCDPGCAPYTFENGKTYEITVISETGATQTFLKKAG